MAAVQGMETYTTRLETFGTAKNGRKGNSKSLKGQNWPLAQPTSVQLAEAGFYFDPTPTSPDNVTCYICLKSLDGWEAEDDPAKEHANFSPDCGFAIHALIEQNVEAGIRDHENPMSERMTEARKTTFGGMWPHEKKRGWTCKTQKLVDAGWYYCPTADSDDFVKCAYCGLHLDGWEPKDKPFDEHQKRSPECQFFVLGDPPTKAKGKAKKIRASKGSRTSAVSVATTIDNITMDETANADDSIMTAATDITAASTTSKAKKSTKAKKGRSKSKASTNAPQPTHTSSFIEPEDDDFEVKVATPQKSVQGKKRKSEEMNDPAEPSEAPAPKRRGTRARSSTVRPEAVVSESLPVEDVAMFDAEIPENETVPKKGKKVGRPRASSAARKTSSSVPAEALSFDDGVATDADLEAALEADLDKQASEEEAPPPPKQPAKRGRASSKTQKSKAAAGAAVPSEVEVEPKEETTEPSTTELSMVTADESIHSATQIENPKQRAPRGGKRVTSKAAVEIHIDETAMQPIDTQLAEPTQTAADDVEEEPQPAKRKGRQPSRKVSRKASRAKPKKADPAPERPAREVLEPAAEDTVIFQPAPEEQPPQAEEEAPPKPKRGRKPGTTNKGRKTKTSTLTQTQADEASVNEAQSAPATTEVIEDEIIEVPPPKRQVSAARPTRKASAKTKAAPKPAPEPVPEPEPELEPEVDVDAESEFEPEQEPEPLPLPVESTPEKPKSAAGQQFPSPTPSPQASDAENQPPSSRPSATRPPLAPLSPGVVVVVPLQQQVVGTPRAQRTGADARLATSYPWSAVDIDAVFAPSPGKENAAGNGVPADLTSPEKRMTVEEWIKWNSGQAQERLRAECERVVGRFESEGVRALKALEGVVAVD